MQQLGYRPPLNESEPEQLVLLDIVSGGRVAIITFNRPHADNAITTELAAQGIEAQTRQVFANLKRVLEGIGLGLGNVAQARVYLLHFDRDYAAMNAVYASHFEPGRRPARTCVGVSGLARGALVEIDFVARRPA